MGETVPHVRDGLAVLISLTIRIDTRLREHRTEKVGRVACPITSASVPCPPSPTASHPDPEPMQLSRACLSPEERQRESALGAAYNVTRLVTLSPLVPCIQQKRWLGSSAGHTVEPNHLLVSPTPLLDSAPLWQSQAFPLPALIDSGAEEFPGPWCRYPVGPGHSSTQFTPRCQCSQWRAPRPGRELSLSSIISLETTRK